MTRLEAIGGAHVEQRTAYRIVARRGHRLRVIGESTVDDAPQTVATWQAAMRGWSVTAEEEHHQRWVSGDDPGQDWPVKG